jgi:uncharacterized protein YndB with AHSA1/START domain
VKARTKVLNTGTFPDVGRPRRMKTGTIRQTIEIRAKPEEVYKALMTTKGHAAFTGAPARISTKVGGKFTAWDGYIHGMNLELVPGKRIVQAWRPSAEGWPEDYYSKVTFDLSPTSRGTKIQFVHSEVPKEHVGHLSSGWHESYWEPLKAYLED